MVKKSTLSRALVLIGILSVSTIIATAQETQIIPHPAEQSFNTGKFSLSSSSRICFAPGLKNEAAYLVALLKDEHQLDLGMKEDNGRKRSKGNIYLMSERGGDKVNAAENYTLNVDDSKVEITGGGSAGVFYGIQSFRQLIDKNKVVPAVSVKDTPRFKWRAFMLDEGRYFKGAQAVKQIMDQMALLKMNVFHWHLTDDQGWRIEIKKYPRLTEVGSTRKESEIGTWLSNKFDGKVHSGYYTQEQIRDIVRYASERHITIIPEIEMPGHASAAMAAYPWLGTANKQIEVVTRFGIQDNVYNVANEKVLQFLHDVLDEVMELFPSDIVHIGGDEVKYDHWKASEEVQKYIRSNNLSSPADLQIQFTNGISNYLQKHGHRMIGWNEILGAKPHGEDSTEVMVSKEKLSGSAIIQFWSGDPETVTKAAMKGHDVINSYWVNTYLDYDYKFTPLEKAYNFDPLPASLPENLTHKVLGIGAQMWGEWIPTVEKMNYQIYPRIAALAEVAWSSKDGRNYDRFAKALDIYIVDHWKKAGITILPEQLNPAQ